MRVFGFLSALGAAHLVLGCSKNPPNINEVGGVELIYQVDTKDVPTDGELGSLAAVLTHRLDRGGTRGISIEPTEKHKLRIAIPEPVDETLLARFKKAIVAPGRLEFRILANPHDHQDVIAVALNDAHLGTSQIRDSDGNPLGAWVKLAKDDRGVYRVSPLQLIVRNAESGEPLTDQNGEIRREFLPSEETARQELLRRFELEDYKSGIPADQDYFENQLGIKTLEVLVATNDGYDIRSADLEMVTTAFDQQDRPSISFSMTADGGEKLSGITTANQPDPDSGFQRRLGIILDSDLVSAPSLRGPIGRYGQITGSFSQAEIDDLVTILHSGELPLRLRETPESEKYIPAKH